MNVVGAVFLSLLLVAVPLTQEAEPGAPLPTAAVQVLLTEASALAKNKQHDAALAVVERALTLARQTGDRAGEATVHRQRALALVGLNRSEDASTAWAEAASAWKTAGDGPGQVEALAWRAVTLMNVRPDDAARDLAQAVTLARGERRRPRAAARQLNFAGGELTGAFHFEQALDLQNAALAIQQAAAPDSPETVATLNGLGVIALGMGNAGAARDHHQKALTIAERASPKSLDVAAALDGLGNVALDRGDTTAAQTYHQRAFEIRRELAPQSMEFAASLNALGRVADSRGDRAAAGDYYERAYDLRRTLAPESLPVAASLNNLGLMAGTANDVAKARDYHQRALAIRQRLAPDSLPVAASHENLGLLAARREDFVASREHLERALAIREQLRPNSPLVAGSISSLGTISWAQGDFAAARAYYGRALAMLEKVAPNSGEIARTLEGLGTLALDEGRDLAAARNYLLSALALYEKLEPDGRAAPVLNKLNYVAKNQGDFVAAREFAERSLAVNERLFPESQDVAWSVSVLGDLAGAQGEIQKARDYYLRALAIHQKNPHYSQYVPGDLKNLAELAMQQGDLVAAASLAERALSMEEKAGASPYVIGETIRILAYIDWARGDLARAKERFQWLLAQEEKTRADSLPYAARLRTLAGIARDEGDFDTARDLSLRALAIHEKLAPDSPLTVEALSTAGAVLLRQGQPVAARAYYERALALEEKLAPESLPHAEILSSLGEVAFREGDVPKAVERASRAWDIVKRQATEIAGDESRQAFGTQYGEIGSKLVRYLIRLGKKEEALVALEDGRAQSLLQLMAERGVVARLVSPDLWRAHQQALAAFNGAGRQLEQAEAKRASAQRALDAEVEQRAAAKTIDEMKRAVAASQAALDEARADYTEARLQSEHRWAAVRQNVEAKVVTPADPGQARRSLQAGDVFLSFLVGEDASTVFVVRSGGRLDIAEVNLTSRELEARVAFVLKAAAGDAGRRGIKVTDDDVRVRAARTLFRALFPPQAREAIAAAKRVILSPDGVLWDLPFATLVMNDAGDYLGLQKALVYTPSLTLLARATDTGGEPRTAAIGALVVANPLYDNARRAEAVKAARADGEVATLTRDGAVPAPLPWAEREGRRVAALYKTTVKTGVEPTEDWFRKNAGQARIIHLATHGYFNPYRALSSGVMLAVPPAGPGEGLTENDGALQAWEILSQVQLNADLVVLSACETGVGTKVSGEGLVGLTRAFQVAGARSVVASQWRVADASTADLMVAFHERLQAGETKDEALRQAMVRLAKNPATAHPYHWAGFVLVGDARPLAARRPPRR